MTSCDAADVYWLQNWLPAGHAAGELLVRELNKAGVTLTAVTSMNVSGQPEITHQDEALAFSKAHGVRMLLNDPYPSAAVAGSYPVLAVGPDGATVLRKGHFPAELFADLLDYDDINLAQAKPASYPVTPGVRARFAGRRLHGRALRQALLAVIHGA